MAYALYTQSFGPAYANAKASIVNATTGAYAIILAGVSGGVVSNYGQAFLDGSGNLSVYIDTAQTWTVSLSENQIPFETPVFLATNPVLGSSSSTLVYGPKNTPVVLPQYTVANLPAPATFGPGGRAFVIDATTPTFGSAPVGGGAVGVPVYVDNTPSWKVG